jgi:CHRD domain
MRRNLTFAALVLAAVAVAAPTTGRAQTVHATLASHHEVPALSTPGSGSFRAKVDVAAGTIHWELQYDGLEADATQSHVHFGQTAVNGGISAFLCTNLGNGPAGTLACPLRSGVLSGVITAATVLGPAGQGIGAGEFAALAAAILDETAYVNVHTVAWPGGEIRGQIR